MVKNSSQKSIKQQQQSILEALQQFPNGASIEEILAVAKLEIDLRTLQRRLEKLIADKKITRFGQTRAIRYHLAEPVPTEKQSGGTAQTGPIISVSEEGKGVLALISRPEAQRKPVGYNREFLELYQPNKDFYLNEEERKNLAKLGRIAGATDQLAGTYAKQILQRLLIDLSWNSSRMEGNTYSLLETERLIELGQAADNKSATEAQMILNHKEAIEFIVQSAEDIGYNRYTILNLHALLSNNLLPDPAATG